MEWWPGSSCQNQHTSLYPAILRFRLFIQALRPDSVFTLLGGCAPFFSHYTVPVRGKSKRFFNVVDRLEGGGGPFSLLPVVQGRGEGVGGLHWDHSGPMGASLPFRTTPGCFLTRDGLKTATVSDFMPECWILSDSDGRHDFCSVGLGGSVCLGLIL